MNARHFPFELGDAMKTFILATIAIAVLSAFAPSVAVAACPDAIVRKTQADAATDNLQKAELYDAAAILFAHCAAADDGDAYWTDLVDEATADENSISSLISDVGTPVPEDVGFQIHAINSDASRAVNKVLAEPTAPAEARVRASKLQDKIRIIAEIF